MEINIRPAHSATVIEVAGELTAATVPGMQEKILPLALSDSKLLLDMSGVPFMSSAGLRTLLMLFRTVKGKGGKIVLTGLREDVRTTLSLVGFLDFFEHRDTVESGLSALG